MIRKYLSPIGELALVVEGGVLVEIKLEGAEVDETDGNSEDAGVLRGIQDWLDKYFEGRGQKLVV